MDKQAYNELRKQMAERMATVEKTLGDMYRACHGVGMTGLTMPILAAWDAVDKALDVLDPEGAQEHVCPCANGEQIMAKLMEIVDGCTSLIDGLPKKEPEHQKALTELRNARTHMGVAYKQLMAGCSNDSHC